MQALIVFLFSLLLYGQVEGPLGSYNLAQNPPQIKWQKIDTEHFEIIFPIGVEAEAQRIAHLLENVYPFVTRSLEVKPPKISLILQTQSVISNGFVTLAPRRSEWFATPAIDPELSNTEWMKTLAIHEFRHVVQFEKSRQNFNRYFEWFLGEYGQALGVGLSYPIWFMEGDAVGIETALTYGGRGRLPMFDRDFRTLLLSGQEFNYDKSHLGSLKDYVPNHYVYGYFWTTYLRNNFGDLFLSKLADEATRKSYNPLSFYLAYRKLTGSSFESFYTSTTQDLFKLWKSKADLIKPTPYAVKNVGEQKVWTNYLYPQDVGPGKIFAIKRGLAHYPRFIVTDGHQEEVVYYPGPLPADYPLKVRNGKVAFTEWELDPRWGYRDYFRLKVLDVNKKKIILDQSKTKSRLAVINFTGDKVLAVDWETSQEQYLVVKNLKGEILKRIPYPSERVVTSVDWLNENEVVMVLKGRDDQKSLVQLDLDTSTEKQLVPPDYVNLGFVTTDGAHILLESPASGIDNIYLVQESGMKQLTSSKFGAYAPQLVSGQLLYNEYTAKGMQIAQKALPWDEEQKSQDSFVPIYQKLAQTEKKHEFEQSLFKQKRYPSQNYSQLKDALNFHSWMLLAPPLSANVTAMAISRNVLNTYALSFGASYDLNERKAQGFVTNSWSYYYPILSLGASYGGRRQDINLNGKKIDNEWEEGVVKGAMDIPWQRIQGRFTHQISLGLFSKLIKAVNQLNPTLTEVGDGALFSNGVDLSYSMLSRLAVRDINPEWGMSFWFHMEEGKEITGGDLKGSLVQGEGRFFLPGLSDHHSFFHQIAYEKQRNDSYQYASAVQKPRGTRSFFLEEFRKYSANYLMPLFYPDWNWSRYFYLKRISTNLFYDELNGRILTYEYKAASAGWEILNDFHILRIVLPLTIGIRGNYILRGYDKHNYEIFLSTSAFNF